MEPKNCSIILIKENSLIGKLIAYFTKGIYSHVAVLVEGKVYESAIRLNRPYVINQNIFANDELKGEIWEPTFEITEEQLRRGKEFLKINYGKPYPKFKMLSFIFIYPTRWFWNKINWVPFSNIFKNLTCGEFVDDFFTSMGIDIFPNLRKGLIVPNDFSKTSMFRFR